MKKTILLLAVLVTFFSSCKKEDDVVSTYCSHVEIKNAVANGYTTEKITLHNCTAADVNLSGWLLGDKFTTAFYAYNKTIPAGDTLQVGYGYFTYPIREDSNTIYLYKPDTTLVDSFVIQ